MAGYANFEVDRNKYSKGMKDIYKKQISVDKTAENQYKNTKVRDGFKKWTSFYRANPHRFIEEYFGVKLFLFQKILVYLFFKYSFFMYLAARGQGKSWLIAVITVAMCVLYPGTIVVIASGTKNQSRLIVTKKVDKELSSKHPNIAREIKHIKSSSNETIVEFQNGSYIESIASTDNARGMRCHVLIVDEARLLKREVIDKILRHFLTTNRQPPYLKNPKYAGFVQENKECYISSCYYKFDDFYGRFKSFANMMVKNKDYFVCGLPWQLSTHHGILSKPRVEQMKTEEDYDNMSWLMEMECLFVGESEDAFFKLEDLNKCRTLNKPFYPISTYDYLQNKGKRKKTDNLNLKKIDNEIRIIGVDIALMSGKESDSTIFTCMRLIPNGEYYIRQVPYFESIHGEHTERLAIRLKQLYEDFECDYICMDTTGLGMGLYDNVTKIIYDPERDKEYPAYCAWNDELMKSRAYVKDALPIIFSLKVGQDINHKVAMYLRDAIEKKRLKLLVNELEGKDFLIDKYDYMNKSIEEQSVLIRPFTQTGMLVNEMVNLQGEYKSGMIKLSEVGRNSKDRYDSLSYANYLAVLLEEKLRKKESTVNLNDFMLIKVPNVYGKERS